MKREIVLMVAVGLNGCVFSDSDSFRRGLVPAEVFAKSVHEDGAKDFSMYRVADKYNQDSNATKPDVASDAVTNDSSRAQQALEAEGYELKRSLKAPPTIFVDYPEAKKEEAKAKVQVASLGHGDYYNLPTTSNPSLWRDETTSDSLFRDFRAFQPMDVITIIINEKTEGKKKADSKAESKFDLLAGIANFFGIETRSWADNNEALDPENMIKASTQSKFDAKGETKREGFLKSRISAVIMEVLPNGILRIEGTKIMSMNAEEEIMVISGLVRIRDVDSTNTIDSSRIANMRIDFYGNGVLGDVQSPGWGYKIIKKIWPF
ncbi:MAG: flagellar basal body L-ring protein FlgH [Deltaproteobacteria bacterium]|nr:flagellar basal body L-ring protein FlgH [Deltaproteobacteria bacterium]